MWGTAEPGEKVTIKFGPRSFNATAEDDGVILTVASDLWNDQAELVVLDARTLNPVASASVDDAIPIGFHGQFFSR